MGIVAIAGYYLYKELGSRETPTGIYNESSKICLESYQLQDALGAPIKVSAESGGRRVFQIRFVNVIYEYCFIEINIKIFDADINTSLKTIFYAC